MHKTKSQYIVNKWEAQKALEGTRYISLMYQYLRILPCEIKDDYRYEVVGPKTIELQTLVDGVWLCVMTFSEVDVEVGLEASQKTGLFKKLKRWIVKKR